MPKSMQRYERLADVMACQKRCDVFNESELLCQLAKEQDFILL